MFVPCGRRAVLAQLVTRICERSAVPAQLTTRILSEWERERATASETARARDRQKTREGEREWEIVPCGRRAALAQLVTRISSFSVTAPPVSAYGT